MNTKRITKIYGIGVNDALYKTVVYEGDTNNKKIVWVCPYFMRWKNMLKRCYCLSHLKAHPSYIGCSVCEEWLIFSNFKSWMETQDWEGKVLDKDLLVYQNKTYSPETCVFIEEPLNLFLTKRFNGRGDFLLGVDYVKNRNKFRARIKDIITHKEVHLGYFISEVEAHKCWQKAKIVYLERYLNKYKEEVRIYSGIYRIKNKIQEDLKNDKVTEWF